MQLPAVFHAGRLAVLSLCGGLMMASIAGAATVHDDSACSDVRTGNDAFATATDLGTLPTNESGIRAAGWVDAFGDPIDFFRFEAPSDFVINREARGGDDAGSDNIPLFFELFNADQGFLTGNSGFAPLRAFLASTRPGHIS